MDFLKLFTELKLLEQVTTGASSLDIGIQVGLGQYQPGQLPLSTDRAYDDATLMGYDDSTDMGYDVGI